MKRESSLFITDGKKIFRFYNSILVSYFIFFTLNSYSTYEFLFYHVNLQHSREYLYDLIYRAKTSKKGRSSSGTLVYYKSKLKGIVYGSFERNHIDKQVYITGFTNSPKHSYYARKNDCNVFDTFLCQLNYFLSSDVLIIGDNFNSAIENQPDFINQKKKRSKLTTEVWARPCYAS